MTKITFITTVNHNIGDDFIREGIIYLLSKLNKKIEYQYIHKHVPITARKGFEKIRSNRFAKYMDRLLPLWVTKDKIINTDFLIQSGAPVYWCHPEIKHAHCADNEWYNPLIKRRLARSSAKFLNIAAGSCQTWNSDGKELLTCHKCPVYIKKLHSVAKYTTVRDKLAQQMLELLEIKAPLIPCSSIFVSDSLKITPKKGGLIAFNFMKGGGHYSFGQSIDYEKWETEFIKFYKDISKKEKCVLVCHNKQEVNYAKEKLPEASTFWSENYHDYMELYSKVKFGMMNRIHGAFPIMSYGKPAVIIGNDTRAKMAEVVGSKSYFVNDMNYENLLGIYHFLNNGADNFSSRFSEIKNRAEQQYLEIFTSILQ